MTIDEVYRLVQTFSNKEQRGFITPKDFNLLAKQAELELYNKRLSIVMEKSQPKKVAGYYSESLSPLVAEQDISPFLTQTPLSIENYDNNPTLGGYNITSHFDYIKSIVALPSDELDINTNTPVEIVSVENLQQVLRSSLAKPSIEYPVALISGGSNGSKRISVFPDTISKLYIWHYTYTNNPKWNYVTIAGKPVYDASNSVGFMLNPNTHGEIVIKILEYLGVSIREADVVQYATAKENQEVKAGN